MPESTYQQRESYQLYVRSGGSGTFEQWKQSGMPQAPPTAPERAAYIVSQEAQRPHIGAPTTPVTQPEVVSEPPVVTEPPVVSEPSVTRPTESRWRQVQAFVGTVGAPYPAFELSEGAKQWMRKQGWTFPTAKERYELEKTAKELEGGEPTYEERERYISALGRYLDLSPGQVAAEIEGPTGSVAMRLQQLDKLFKGMASEYHELLVGGPMRIAAPGVAPPPAKPYEFYTPEEQKQIREYGEWRQFQQLTSNIERSQQEALKAFQAMGMKPWQYPTAATLPPEKVASFVWETGRGPTPTEAWLMGEDEATKWAKWGFELTLYGAVGAGIGAGAGTAIRSFGTAATVGARAIAVTPFTRVAAHIGPEVAAQWAQAGATAAKVGTMAVPYISKGVWLGVVGVKGYQTYKMYEAGVPLADIFRSTTKDIALMYGFYKGFKWGAEHPLPLRVERALVGEKPIYTGLIWQTDEHVKFLLGKTPEGWMRGFPWLKYATIAEVYGPQLTVGYVPRTTAETEIALRNVSRYWPDIEAKVVRGSLVIQRTVLGTPSAYIRELPFRQVFVETHRLPAKYQQIFERWLRQQEQVVFGSAAQEAQLGIKGLPPRVPHDIDVFIKNVAKESDRLYSEFMRAGGRGLIWREDVGLFRTTYGHFLDIKDISAAEQYAGSFFQRGYIGFGFKGEEPITISGLKVMPLSEQAVRKTVSSLTMRWEGVWPEAWRTKDIVDMFRANLGLVKSQAAFGMETAQQASSTWGASATNWLQKVGPASDVGREITALVRFQAAGISIPTPKIPTPTYFGYYYMAAGPSPISAASAAFSVGAYGAYQAASISRSLASASKALSSPSYVSPAYKPYAYPSVAKPSPLSSVISSISRQVSRSASSAASSMSSSVPKPSYPSYPGYYYSYSPPPYSSPSVPPPMFPSLEQQWTARVQRGVGRYKPFERRWPVGEIERAFRAPKFKEPKIKLPSERDLKKMFKVKIK